MALLMLAISCQNKPEQTTTTSITDTVKPVPDSVETVQITNGTTCFAYYKNQDTILMTLHLTDSLATGNLTYNLYEKDKNKGTFQGVLTNDTLIANYTFSSEGTRSVRQVAFLLKGNILQQGFGNMKEQNGRLVFTSKKDIAFDNTMILEPVDCDTHHKK